MRNDRETVRGSLVTLGWQAPDTSMLPVPLLLLPLQLRHYDHQDNDTYYYYYYYCHQLLLQCVLQLPSPRFREPSISWPSGAAQS